MPPSKYQVYDRKSGSAGRECMGDDFYLEDEEDEEDDIDIFSPEFVKSRVANYPELIELVKDPEVMSKLNESSTTAYLREISLDPTKIPSLLDKPEIKFLKEKMEALIKKTYPDAYIPV